LEVRRKKQQRIGRSKMTGVIAKKKETQGEWSTSSHDN